MEATLPSSDDLYIFLLTDLWKPHRLTDLSPTLQASLLAWCKICSNTPPQAVLKDLLIPSKALDPLLPDLPLDRWGPLLKPPHTANGKTIRVHHSLLPNLG